MKASVIALGFSVATCFFIGIFSKEKIRIIKHDKEKTSLSDWFYMQRAFPYGKIDHAAYYNAAKKELAPRANHVSKVSATLWQEAGSRNIGGRITDVEMDPTSFLIAYLGAASGGVFKTTDGGSTWNPIFDNQPALSIGDIDLAPSNSSIIYVGTGEANGGSGSLTYEGNGVYKSTDAGATWTHVGLDSSHMIGRVAVHPNDADTVFVASMGDLYGEGPWRGLFRTADGGATWTKVFGLTDSSGCIDVVINPQNPNHVYCAMWERVRRPDRKNYAGPSSGIWRSTDAGNTWTQMTNGLPPAGTSYGRPCIDLCTSNPNVMYALYLDNSNSFLGLYKSTNGGTSWIQTNDASLSGAYGGSGYWFGRIKCDPTDQNTVYIIAFDMYKTSDGGLSYSGTFNFVHVDQHEVAVHPLNNDFVMLGNDGGLYISYNGGDTWTHNETLPITQFYACETDYNNANALYGGTQDNGTIRTLTGLHNDWIEILGGDGFVPLVDPNNSNILFAEYQYGGLYNSFDQGFTMNYAMSGVTGTANWKAPVLFNPLNSSSVYFADQKVYKAANSANITWNPISPDLVTIYNTNLLFGTITALDVSPLDTNIIFAGTDDGQVWMTDDEGNTWNDVSAGLPQRWVTSVSCDPFDVNKVYVTLSGYRYHDNMSHVYVSSNLGTTWTDIGNNLPDIPVSDILPDPLYDSTLYLATDIGVYWSNTDGTSWNTLGSGMPVIVVNDLDLHIPTRTLVAATYGRSMYKMDLNVFLGVKPEQGKLFVRVFPNPASDFLNICFSEIAGSDISVSIYDLRGRKKAEQQFKTVKGKNNLEIDLTKLQLTQGQYLLELKEGTKMSAWKIIVQ